MADPRNTPSSPLIEALVTKCLERDESGGDPAIDEVCKAHPELRDAVLRRIEMLKRMGLVSATEAPVPPSEAVPIRDFPERLGDFQLLRRIGGGGMGVVYAARQESLGREVALKLIRPEHLYFDGAKQRFRREVEAIAALAHPGIVPIYTVGEEKGIPYYAMEHVAGSPLSELLEKTRGLDVAELTGADFAGAIAGVDPIQAQALGERLGPTWIQACLRVMHEVCDALAHAHSRGIIHRDIKPSNVILRPDGRAVLLDFGLALQQGGNKLTQTGSALGSPHYMAPEVWSGGGAAADARSDVYSLGVTLYEMLSLVLPFQGQTEELVVQVLQGEAEALRRRNPNVPWDVETVCLKAMEVDVGRRYASATEFKQDLQNLLELRPILAARPSSWIRAKRFMQRRPGTAMAGLLAFVLVVVFPLGYASVLRVKNQEIERKNREINRQREAADAQRAIAESHRNSTLIALNAMISGYADRTLDDVPGIEELRRRTLEQVDLVVKGLFGTETQTRDLRRRTLGIVASIGHLTARLGNHEGALKRGLELIADAEKIFGANTDDRTVALFLGSERMFAGEMLAALGRVDESMVYYAEAVKRLERLVQSDPEDLEARYQLIRALGGSAGIHHEAGRIDDSVEFAAKTRTALGDALLRWPDDQALNRRWIETNSIEAVRLAYRGDLDAAKALHDAVAARFLDRGFDEVDSSDQREFAAEMRSNLSEVCAMRQEHAECVAWLEGSIADLRVLTVRYPMRPNYKHLLARSLAQIAENRNFVEHSSPEATKTAYDTSLREFEEASQLFESLESAGVADEVLASDHCAALGSWGDWLQRGGDVTGALQKYQQADVILGARLELNPNSPTDNTNRAINLTEVGRVLARLGRFEEAQANIADSWTILEATARAKTLSTEQFHRHGGKNRLVLATIYVELHRHVEALAALEPIRNFTLDSTDRAEAIRKLAFIIEDAQADSSMPGLARDHAISNAAGFAVAQLTLLKAGGNDVEWVRDDEVFAALRETREFRDWAALNLPD